MPYSVFKKWNNWLHRRPRNCRSGKLRRGKRKAPKRSFQSMSSAPASSISARESSRGRAYDESPDMSSGMWREIQNCGPTKIDVMENFKKRSSYSYTDKVKRNNFHGRLANSGVFSSLPTVISIQTDEFVAHLLVLPDEVVIYILSYLRTLTGN